MTSLKKKRHTNSPKTRKQTPLTSSSKLKSFQQADNWISFACLSSLTMTNGQTKCK